MLAKTVNGDVVQFPYTVANLQADNPYTNYGPNPDIAALFPATDAGLAGATVTPVVLGDVPAYDPTTQCLATGPLINLVGVWTQPYIVQQMTPDQQAAYQSSLVPPQVTAAQAKIALQNAGLYSTVVAYMQTASVVDQIAWEYSSTFSPSSPMLQNLAGALNLTTAQVQSLFIAAAAVVV